MKVAIIDDNKGARNAIKAILRENFEETFEIKEANSVLSGHKLIQEFSPKILLLDVEMGDGTGLDLLQLFDAISFKLVFITAHKEYAIRAIKHRPHGYLLKPFNPFELIKLINSLLFSEDSTSKENTKRKILIKNQDSSMLVEIDQIIRLEANGAYTNIITMDSKYLASKNLKYFQNLLPSHRFLRIHHSHLINSEYIKEFNRYLQEGIILKNEDRIPVSTRKVKIITTYLESLQ